MLIRKLAYCGLAASACWAGVAYPGASTFLTSTARSVPTLDQVSRIQTPGYMSAGRTYDSFVLAVTDAPGSAGSANVPAVELTVVQAAFGSNGFQVDTTSFSTADSGASQRQFVNLLAGSTTVGSDAGSGASPSSVSGFSNSVSGAATDATSGGTAGGSSSTGGTSSTGSGSSNGNTGGTVSKYNMSALAGSIAAPQVIAIPQVPEPSTGVAAGLATGLLAWMRFRKHNRK